MIHNLLASQRINENKRKVAKNIYAIVVIRNSAQTILEQSSPIHVPTNRAQHCLNSVIVWELVFPSFISHCALSGLPIQYIYQSLKKKNLTAENIWKISEKWECHENFATTTTTITEIKEEEQQKQLWIYGSSSYRRTVLSLKKRFVFHLSIFDQKNQLHSHILTGQGRLLWSDLLCCLWTCWNLLRHFKKAAKPETLDRKETRAYSNQIYSLHQSTKCLLPAKILSPFLSTGPLQYVPKILFTPATIDCLTTNKTKNALHKETLILNNIGTDPISHGLSNEPFVNVL